MFGIQTTELEASDHLANYDHCLYHYFYKKDRTITSLSFHYFIFSKQLTVKISKDCIRTLDLNQLCYNHYSSTDCSFWQNYIQRFS